MKYTVIITILILSACCANAQQKISRSSAEWRKEVREYKHKILVDAMKLTGDTKDKFLKLYSAMEDEVYAANSDARSYASKVASNANAADNDFDKAAQALVDAKTKEEQIESEYHDKLKTDLTKKQLFQLKIAENKFAKNMLSHSKKQAE